MTTLHMPFIDQLLERAKRACASGLAGVPPWVVIPGFRRQRSRSLIVPDGAVPEDGVDLQPGLPVDVIFGKGAFLTRTVKLPRVAARRREAVIDVQMRQTLPNQGRDLIWRAGRGAAAGSELLVPVYILKRQRIAELLTRLAQHRVSLRTLRVEACPDVPPFVDNRSQTDRALRLWGIVSMAVPVATAVGCVAALVVQTSDLGSRTAALEAQKAALLSEAARLRAQADMAERSRASSQADLGYLLARTGRLDLLSALTRVLDERVWLSNLQIYGVTLRLSGFVNGDIVDVIDRLQAESWSAGVRLEGPVAFDPLSGWNRFELSMRLVSP